VTGLLIAAACLGVFLVTEVAVAYWWLRKEFHSLINEAVVPWMVAILKAIQDKK
jgi:hypothetical protein